MRLQEIRIVERYPVSYKVVIELRSLTIHQKYFVRFRLDTLFPVLYEFFNCILVGRVRGDVQWLLDLPTYHPDQSRRLGIDRRQQSDPASSGVAHGEKQWLLI